MLLYKEPWFLDNILLYNVLNWLIRLIYNLLYFISDILDGDIKSILDVLWLIILNYAVHSIGKFTMISNISSLAVHVFTYLCYNEVLLILCTYLFWEPTISQLVSMIIVYYLYVKYLLTSKYMVHLIHKFHKEYHPMKNGDSTVSPMYTVWIVKRVPKNESVKMIVRANYI